MGSRRRRLLGWMAWMTLRDRWSARTIMCWKKSRLFYRLFLNASFPFVHKRRKTGLSEVVAGRFSLQLPHDPWPFPRAVIRIVR